MSKKRVTRNSSRDQHQNLLEYEFNNNPENLAPKIESAPQQNELKKPIKKTLSRSYTQVKFPDQPKQESLISNLTRSALSNSQKPKNLNVKKKKVSNEEQNEGLRLIKEKQTENIFKHFCTPEGFITVESLGSVLVRAKKQFETQDLQNMIDYFNTINEKVKGQKNTLKSKNQNNEQKNEPKIQNNKQKARNNPLKNKKNSKYQNQDSESQESVPSSDEQRVIDYQMDSEISIQKSEEIKTQLNFQQFKILIKYFDKE